MCILKKDFVVHLQIQKPSSILKWNALLLFHSDESRWDNLGLGAGHRTFMNGRHFDLVLVSYVPSFSTRRKWAALFCSGLLPPVSGAHFTTSCSTWERVRFGTSRVGPGKSLHRFFPAGQNYELSFEAVYRACSYQVVYSGICLGIRHHNLSQVLVTRAPLDNLPR